MVTEKSRIAALVALADAGIPVDVQELLLKNNAFDKALEAALSTDAEPVIYVSEKQLAQCVGHYVPSRKEADGNFQLALYRAPPAPSVAVKADLPERSEEWWTGRDSKGEKTLDYNQRKQLAWDAFYAAALSAQVQDVAGYQDSQSAKLWPGQNADTVIKEMQNIATGEYDGYEDTFDPWTADNRADIDRWQSIISDTLTAAPAAKLEEKL